MTMFRERLESEWTMPIELTCSCGKLLRVADEYAGRQGQCPACGRLLDIPSSESALAGLGPTAAEERQRLIANAGLGGIEEPAAPESTLPPLPGLSPEGPQVARPAFKLYSPGHVGLAAFLGGPVGAFLLLAINYFRLGKRRAGWSAIV